MRAPAASEKNPGPAARESCCIGQLVMTRPVPPRASWQVPARRSPGSPLLILEAPAARRGFLLPAVVGTVEGKPNGHRDGIG